MAIINDDHHQHHYYSFTLCCIPSFTDDDDDVYDDDDDDDDDDDVREIISFKSVVKDFTRVEGSFSFDTVFIKREITQHFLKSIFDKFCLQIFEKERKRAAEKQTKFTGK